MGNNALARNDTCRRRYNNVRPQRLQRVRVGARTEADQFKLWVANAGDPIPATAMEKLFEPFFRGNVRDSRQGLGLGLHIASQIAQAHGGRIDVTSTAEETRFVFTMPLA